MRGAIRNITNEQSRKEQKHHRNNSQRFGTGAKIIQQNADYQPMQSELQSIEALFEVSWVKRFNQEEQEFQNIKL
jgi:hypothetical protein